MPTRVLDVESDDSDLVYLRESKSLSTHQTPPYVMLSHCWGPSQPFTTTKENLKSRINGITLLDMPQTFQNAVFLTRALGLRYLWIDSLCIIQNDIDDWNSESTSMMALYSAAADSEGFLQPRETTLVSLAQKSYVAKLQPPEAQRLGHTRDGLVGEPLSTRAWCLQERLLSNRMVLFGKEQIYWECQGRLASEEGECFPCEGNPV
jgi:hypothetical protein